MLLANKRSRAFFTLLLLVNQIHHTTAHWSIKRPMAWKWIAMKVCTIFVSNKMITRVKWFIHLAIPTRIFFQSYAQLQYR